MHIYNPVYALCIKTLYHTITSHMEIGCQWHTAQMPNYTLGGLKETSGNSTRVEKSKESKSSKLLIVQINQANCVG